MTNGDRIRQMSDEELASVMGRSPSYRCPPEYLKTGFMSGRCHMGCGNCWLEWLKQEVQEDG